MITSFSNVIDQNPQVQTSGGPKKLSGRISPGCGNNYFRCQNLLVETGASLTNEVTRYILFVPLKDHVHLVELSISNDSTVQFGAEYEISTTTQGCSPSAMFKVGNVIYTICVDIEENSVALYEIRLNKKSLSQSYMLSMADGEYLFQTGQNIANASNFLYMEYNYDTYIFFAINNTLYAIRPSEGSIDNFGPIGASCRNVNELVLTGNDGEILAYCDRHLVYYSMDSAYWTLEETYENAGRRYICPDSTLHLSVFTEQPYITYNTTGSKENISISSSILSGVCYGSANHSFFAYIEEQEGLFLLDTLTATVHSITSISCHNMSCQPLLVAENRYLIIRNTDNGDGTMWVMDTGLSSNLSLIFEAQHTSPDLLALVVDMNLTRCFEPHTTTELPTENSTSVSTADTTKPESVEVHTIVIVVPVIVGIFVLIVVIVIVVLVICVVAAKVVRLRNPDSQSLVTLVNHIETREELKTPVQATNDEPQHSKQISSVYYNNTPAAHHDDKMPLLDSAESTCGKEEYTIPVQDTNDKNAPATITTSPIKPVPQALVDDKLKTSTLHANNNNTHR